MGVRPRFRSVGPSERGALIRAVLFDLDDTLFDHDHATNRALSALRATEPAFREWAPAELVSRHSVELEAMHLEVLAGRQSIDNAREERFRRLFEAATGRSASAQVLGSASRILP